MELLALIGLVAGGWWCLRSARWRWVDPDPALLEDLELRREGDAVVGVRDDRPFEIRTRHRLGKTRTVVIAPLLSRIPTPFLIQQQDPRRMRNNALGVAHLDVRLEVRTPNTTPPEDFSWLTGQSFNQDLRPPADLPAFLHDEGVVAALEVLIPGSRENSRVNGGGVTLIEQTGDPDRIEAMITDATLLAAALDDAADPWQRVAMLLSLRATPFDEMGDRSLSGTLQGWRVRAAPILDRDDEVSQTEVIVEAPAGVSIRAGSGGIRLGNPILNGLVEVVAVDEAATRTALSHPEAAEDVLAVIHAWSGSTVASGEIRIIADGQVEAADLKEMITAGVRLAIRLRADLFVPETPPLA